MTATWTTAWAPLAGRDARQVYADLLAKAERGELIVDGRSVSTLEFQFAVFGTFYGPDWRGLAEFLAFLADGAAVSRAKVLGEPINDPFQAVFCQDWNLPIRHYFELAAYRRVIAATVAPDVKGSPLGELATISCLGWPSNVRNPQHALRFRHTPPILMVNSRFDPATPYQWATNAARQSGSVLLHYDGWGHGAYFAGSSCVTGAVDHYLITGQTPPRDTHCPGVEPPTTTTLRQKPASVGPWLRS